MIHAGNTSYYPKAGMFREGRRMYSVPTLPYSDWRLYVERGARVLVTRISGGPAETRDSMWTLVRTSYSDGWPAIQHVRPTLQGIFPAIHVWRIQRVVRLFLRKQYEQRALALAMGLHARLGGQLCAYACLPADLLRHVILS
jgi:hypothetical protein